MLAGDTDAVGDTDAADETDAAVRCQSDELRMIASVGGAGSAGWPI